MTTVDPQGAGESQYAINPQPLIQVDYVGPERVPVITLDNVTLDAGAAIRQQALDVQFEPEARFMYPGVRAPLPPGYVLEVLQAANTGFYHIYNIPPDKKLKLGQASFSLITQMENQLSLMQSIPHFDTSDAYFFAILHYLGEGDHGDTGLFQHLPTGFCSITAEREELYLQSVQGYFEKHGKPAAGYITESSGQFRLYHRITYKPNRLVIYPGNLLHSTLVNKRADISSSPVQGRLTANIFVRYE